MTMMLAARLCVNASSYVTLLCFATAFLSLELRGAETGDESIAPPQCRMIVVVGAAGTPEYGKQFEISAKQWADLGKQAGAIITEIGTDPSGEKSDVDLLQTAIESLDDVSPETARPHWLVLIGHGTFQFNVAKFNLRGRDADADQLAKWLEGAKHPLVIVNTASSSGPFVNALSGPSRIIVTATRSGEEQDFARFGGFLPKALGDGGSDLDHDDEVSLLEAVLKAASETGEFYKSEGRIQTEHTLVDDNGDRLGTPAEMLNSVLRGTPDTAAAPTKSTTGPAQLDGNVASKTILVSSKDAAVLLPAELITRARIESELTALRAKKTALSEDEYFAQLEKWMLELAVIYQTAEKRDRLPGISP